jgi:hypothetical protein
MKEISRLFDDHISVETLKSYDVAVSSFTPRPVCPAMIYDSKVFYNIIYDTETNTTGKAAVVSIVSYRQILS